jgi:hypothetical protein
MDVEQLAPQSVAYGSNQFSFNTLPNSYFINNGDLIINSVTLKSQSWYKCEAENLLGSVNANMFLQIKSIDKFVTYFNYSKFGYYYFVYFQNRKN